MVDLDGLLKTIEPLVLQIHALQDELAEVKARKPVEPLVLELDELRRQLDELRRHRLDVPAWAPGVYRQGVVVQHFHGQYFEAAADTAAEPGDGVAWRRLGLHGFRYRGLHIEGAEYDAGDLVAKDGGLMLQTAGRLNWFSIRGHDGKRGAPGQAGQPGQPGKDGAPGKRGADGANLVKLEAAGGLLWAVMSDGRREPMALEAVEVGA